MPARWCAWVAGLWAGMLWGVGLLGAPAGFATTTREIAGRAAGRMFAQEAYVSLAVAVVLFLMLRRKARIAADRGTGSVLGTVRALNRSTSPG